ncbi:MAG: hypothetical protein A3F67_07035 [Verrucomicrobia bacterium RIFCSPHIGHO2_12_FULL_41_10]|nr:MAG: hypothetical protein A3F67_07035 [Verrucomicrobia bacterium RIFCSPHIGHO2_12_FULL_41_10]
MAKHGRPGIPYEKFVEAWEQLLHENRAGTNAAHDVLGGSKTTIAAYRERYEREKSSKEISILKSVELTEAVHQAIASIKVKEIDALEKNNAQLKSRIDDYLTSLKETEEKLAVAKVDLEDAKTGFEMERLKLERKLSATQARIEDMEQREQKLTAQYGQLGDHYNQTKQEAAVAKKEVEMLREQMTPAA